MSAGLADDDFTTIEKFSFRTRFRPTPKVMPICRFELPEGEHAKPLQAKLIVDVAEPGGRTVERVADAAGAREER